MNATSPPPWWKAWQRVVPLLIESGVSGKRAPKLDPLLGRLRDAGWQCESLFQWQPTKAQANALKRAQSERSKVLDPSFAKPDSAYHRTRRLLREASIPDALMTAFDANISHLEPVEQREALKAKQKKEKAARESKAKSRAKTKKRSKKEQPTGPTSQDSARAKATSRPKPSPKLTRARRAQQRLERARLEMPSATDWGRDSSELLICIDETWPLTGGPGKAAEKENSPQSSEGVIAGVVWQGAAPDFDVLPAARDHRYASPQAYEILEQLFRCRRAMPFIMPIRLDDRHGQASQHYDDLLQASIQIVLGWLLPVDGEPAQLRIWMDHDSRHPHGFDQTDFYRGLLRGHQRFARYDIREVAWYDLDRIDSYIAYADQLAYLARESTKANRELGQVAKYKQLPGYVPLSMLLVQRLKRLEHLEENGDVENFLDLAVELRQTRIGELLVEDVRRRLVDRHDLQLRLLETLDRRYQHPGRDLRKLEKAVDVTRRVVSIPRHKQGIRARLLATAVQFQSANYDGDPHRVALVASEYQAIRRQALEDVPELAIECDVHLAGVWAEHLEFERAAAIARRWIDEERFGYLPRFLRAKVWTSLGRFQAANENHRQADLALEEAVALVEAAQQALPSLVGWREIPATYRAHNAIDARCDQWYQRLVDALGDPEILVDQLLANQRPKHHRYRHRLLLHAMAAFGRSEPLRPLTRRYLDARAEWAMYEGEPWPDIGLYRAYVLWQDKEPQAASRWFDRALLALASRRCEATLQLFLACIAATAYSCFDDQHFYEEAQEAILAAEPKLPAAEPLVRQLKLAISRPDAARVPALMSRLKFHYL